jgi:hypothetical protein
MPARANAFYKRLPQTDWLKAHTYHGTTNARVAQAKFYLEHLIEEVMRPDEDVTEFYKRDMFLFGLVNSLRSSLDSFAHQLFLFYGGTVGNKRDVNFNNLLRHNKIQISLSPCLADHIKKFQKSDTFKYLTKLRNVNQHRNIALIQTQSVARMGFDIVSANSNGGRADWLGGSSGSQATVQAEPVVFSPIEPDLRLPDDPGVEPGDETFSQGRPLLGTMRRIHADTHEFVFSAYDLAT